MIEIFGFLWARPVWLLLLIAAVACAVLIARSSTRLGAWERAVDSELLVWLRRTGGVSPGRGVRTVLPALVLAVLAVALAGPSTEQRETTSYRNLDAMVLVVDLSPSITRSDRMFDMLATARLLAEAAGTRQTGLVVYAGEAYVAQPFSTDGKALSGTLALLDAETMPVEGSRPAIGLDRARRLLDEARIIAADVVLLSDGGAVDEDALAVVRGMADRGWVTSALHVPGQTPQPGLMETLARAGQGAYATLDDPFPVARAIQSRPVERLADTGFAMLVLQDYGRYLLLLALLPAFLMLPRRRDA